jgi:hypothetical protein
MGFMGEFGIIEGNGPLFYSHMAEGCAGDFRLDLVGFIIFVDGCQSLFGLIVGHVKKLDRVLNIVDPSAEKYGELTYLEVLSRQLKVMDATAISLCMDNGFPIVIFNLHAKGCLRQLVFGERVGTLVRGG